MPTNAASACAGRAGPAALETLPKENRDALVAAISRDHGNRANFETLFTEYFVVLDGIRDTIRHLKCWMQPMKRHVGAMVYPLAKKGLIPLPLGVEGRDRPVELRCHGLPTW